MSKGIYASSLNGLATLFTNIRNIEQMSGFLEDILTPQEIIEIGERIELCRQLLQDKTQKEVAEQLGISVTTVNRWARILKFGTGTMKEVIQ